LRLRPQQKTSVVSFLLVMPVVDFEVVEAATDVERVTLAPRPIVLVVDDDEDMRAMVAATLRRNEMDVIEARHGLQVLDYVTHSMLDRKNALPDVIVSDAQMPGVNGLSLLESLRGCGCEVPVVFMTAFAGPGFREKAARLGAAEVLEKPFDDEALCNVVLKQLGR
jgi:CheY-like chemotaxis protein